MWPARGARGGARYAGSRFAYRLLLRVFPRAFRRRCGAEMERAFLDSLTRCAAAGGRMGLARGWAAALLDVLIHGCAERFVASRRLRRGLQRALGVAFDDGRWAIRALLSHRRVSAMIIVSLAIALAANTLMFGVLHALIYRPMALPDPDRLARVYARSQFRPEPSELAYVEYADVRDELARAELAQVAAHKLVRFGLEAGDDSDVVWGELVSDNYFSVLGLQPAVGRWFTVAGDRPGSLGIVIGHRLWQRRFDGSPHLGDLRVRLNGTLLPVIGVAPAGFVGTEFGLALDLWAPLALQDRVSVSATAQPGSQDSWRHSRSEAWLEVLARLRPGVAIEQARAALAARVDPRADGAARDLVRFEVQPERLSRLDPGAIAALPTLTLLTHLLLFLVLVAAAANVATLLLARMAGRRSELALRLALGASVPRVASQLFAEAALLSASGYVVGATIAYGAAAALTVGYPPPAFPIELDIAPGVPGLLYGAAMAATVGCAITVPCVAAAVRIGLPGGSLRSGRSRAGEALRGSLVTVQIAAAIVLLVATGATVRRAARERLVDLGFATESVLVGSIDLEMGAYDGPAGHAFQRRLLDEIRGIPGVDAAALAQNLPLGDRFQSTVVAPTGGPRRGTATGRSGAATPVAAEWNRVSDGYFDALRISVLGGRSFRSTDGPESAPVAIVNRALAQRLWPSTTAPASGGSSSSEGVPASEGTPASEAAPFSQAAAPWEAALGRRVTVAAVGTVTVVAVVADTRYRGLIEAPPPLIYVPMAQAYSGETTLILRSTADRRTLAEAIGARVRAIDRRIPVFYVHPLLSHVSMARWWTTASGAIALVAGLLVLFLAMVGVSGIASYAMRRRRLEFGIRLACGADPRRLARVVLRAAWAQTAAGTAIGLGAAVAASRAASTMSADVGLEPVGPGLLLLAGACVATVVILAGYVPARRARALRPAEVIRQTQLF